MKRLLSLVLVLILTMSFVACGEYEYTLDEERYTEQMKEQSLDTVGLPDIVNFFEMSQLKEIYEMRDNPDLIMHWYTKNENPLVAGQWVYEGMCVGYGIPYGASITSPEVSEYHNNGGTVTIPLAEPNGLYTNTVTSSATWILALNSDGEISPEYVEPEIRVVQEKLERNLCVQEYLPSDY